MTDQEVERADGGGGDRWDSERYGLTMWEDTVAKLILGTKLKTPLDYDLGLELHHPIMSMLGGHGGRL